MRRRIAVITARADASEQRDILYGISEAAFRKDTDVAVYSNIYNHWQDDDLLNYENIIYSLFEPDLFDGVIEKSGIYNGKDPYTSYGDRKSFEQLHYEETLENVVKVMKQQANGEGALFSGLGLWGVAAKNYGTIEELKQDENRLQTMDEEEYSKIKNQFGERFTEIAASIVEHREGQNEFIEMDNAFENILGAVRNCKTKYKSRNTNNNTSIYTCIYIYYNN